MASHRASYDAMRAIAPYSPWNAYRAFSGSRRQPERPLNPLSSDLRKPVGNAGPREAEPGRTRFARLETEGCSETEIGPGASLRGSGVSASALETTRKRPPTGSLISGSLQDNGGGSGIRTHDTLLRYTHFPGVRLRPLGHPSSAGRTIPTAGEFAMRPGFCVKSCLGE